MNPFDAVVIGGGAAGLSGALVLARAQRTVLVVDSQAPRNAPAAHMHGYLSRDGITPSEFLDLGRREVAQYDGSFTTGRVTHVSVSVNGLFNVQIEGADTVSARRLLLTTGLRDQLPDLQGLSDLWGRAVLHCPYCHGHEVRGQRLGVLGTTSSSAHYAQIVRQWSDDVILFALPGQLDPDERAALAARNVAVVQAQLSQVHARDGGRCSMETADGRVFELDALFVPPTFVPNDGLLAGLGCAVDAEGWVTADKTGLTSVPGVWVAGNVVNPRAQVITAAGEGSAAAIALNTDLVDEDVRQAVSRFATAKPEVCAT